MKAYDVSILAASCSGALVGTLAIVWGIKSYNAAATANDLALIANQLAGQANQMALVTICQAYNGVSGHLKSSV